ncbi:MAG: hypothetical protein JO340_03485 [Acidobacteriaceae bacterium]|nr:hypothetical protein [Acidobacteriaceae bacterium]
MSTEAQICANRENAQHSTGPKSETGKAASCLNNFRHGFTGAFRVLPSEDQREFDHLLASLCAEHQPSTVTEAILVEKMAQAHWLSLRAQRLQDLSMGDDLPVRDCERQFALYLRYQTANDRAFHKCLNDLLKLRAERRRMEIGFESQQAAEAEIIRKQEAHEARTRLANAKAAHLELDTEVRSTIEARIPGDIEIPFDRLKDVLRVSLQQVARDMAAQKAA